MKKTFITWIKIDIILFLIVCAYYGILNIIGATCVIKWIFGVNCPTCGMTRAIISLLKGNVCEYFILHPLALPTAIIVYFSFHINNKKNKKIFNLILILLAILILAWYIFIN